MKRTIFPLLLLTFLLLMSGCRTTKSAVNPGTNNAASAESAEAFTASVMDCAVTTPAITAKIKAELNVKGRNVSVGGSLRMKRDDVIQLSLTLLGFEVARAEFSPKDVLVIDRYNKRYVRAAYDQVGFLKEAGLNFYSLQSLFWNELFVPGEQRTEKALHRFRMGASGSHTLLSLYDTPELNYDFLTQTATHLIDRLTVQGKSSHHKGKFVWRYANFANFAGKQFPTTMNVSVSGTGKADGTMNLSLSNLKADTDWEAHTTPGKNYKAMNAESIFKLLLQ